MTSGFPAVSAERVHWQVLVARVGLERVGSVELIDAVVGEVLVRIPGKVRVFVVLLETRR